MDLLALENTPSQPTTARAVKATSREQWLIDASEYIMTTIILPIVDLPAPPYKVSVGFPYRNSKAIGVCHPRAHSKDGNNEIFIRPDLDDSARILGVLTHELIHATDNCKSGHKNFFAKTARAVGLEGKLTATTEGPELTDRLNTFIMDHGHIPHSAMINNRSKPKQTTRMKKIVCGGCGFTARTSQKWLDQLTDQSTCPVCSAKRLLIE